MSSAKPAIFLERVRRLRILRLVLDYVKQAGGWNKAFPPDGGVYETSFDFAQKDDAWIVNCLTWLEERGAEPLLRCALLLLTAGDLRCQRKECARLHCTYVCDGHFALD
jgi:hypothetical protein